MTRTPLKLGMTRYISVELEDGTHLRGQAIVSAFTFQHVDMGETVGGDLESVSVDYRFVKTPIVVMA